MPKNSRPVVSGGSRSLRTGRGVIAAAFVDLPISGAGRGEGGVVVQGDRSRRQTRHRRRQDARHGGRDVSRVALMAGRPSVSAGAGRTPARSRGSGPCQVMGRVRAVAGGWCRSSSAAPLFSVWAVWVVWVGSGQGGGQEGEGGDDDGDAGVVVAVPAVHLFFPVGGPVLGGPCLAPVVDRDEQQE